MVLFFIYTLLFCLKRICNGLIVAFEHELDFMAQHRNEKKRKKEKHIALFHTLCSLLFSFAHVFNCFFLFSLIHLFVIMTSFSNNNKYKKVLCKKNKVNKKYYLRESTSRLPERIKEEVDCITIAIERAFVKE